MTVNFYLSPWFFGHGQVYQMSRAKVIASPPPRWGSGVLWWPCLSVCQSVGLSTSIYLQNYTSDLHQTFGALPMFAARSSSGGVEIRYVLPVYGWRHFCTFLPSVLSRCWLGCWKGIRPVKHWWITVAVSTQQGPRLYRCVVATWRISLVMTNCPPIGRGQGHVTHVLILGLMLYLWSGWS